MVRDSECGAREKKIEKNKTGSLQQNGLGTRECEGERKKKLDVESSKNLRKIGSWLHRNRTQLQNWTLVPRNTKVERESASSVWSHLRPSFFFRSRFYFVDPHQFLIFFGQANGKNLKKWLGTGSKGKR